MIPYILIIAAAALWFWPEIAAQLPKKPEPKPEPEKKPARKRKEPARNERHK